MKSLAGSRGRAHWQGLGQQPQRTLARTFTVNRRLPFRRCRRRRSTAAKALSCAKQRPPEERPRRAICVLQATDAEQIWFWFQRTARLCKETPLCIPPTSAPPFTRLFRTGFVAPPPGRLPVLVFLGGLGDVQGCRPETCQGALPLDPTRDQSLDPSSLRAVSRCFFLNRHSP